MNTLFRKLFRFALPLAVLGFALASPAQAQFVYREITVPGLTDFSLSGANDLGDIVGAYKGADGSDHPFAYVGGVVSDIVFPGADFASVTGLNNKGQVCGFEFIPGVNYGSAFIWQNGAFTPFDYPGSPGTLAFGINDRGQLAGDIYDAAYSNNRAFVAGDGVLDSYAVPGAPDTYGGPITNNGLRGVAAIYPTGNINYILDANGTLSDPILLPGYDEFYLNAISEDGLALLGGKDADDNSHGYLRNRDGSLVALDVPGSLYTTASDFDSAGRIYGFYAMPNGVRYGFVATAVPEPGTIALLSGLGIYGVGLFARHRACRNFRAAQ